MRLLKPVDNKFKVHLIINSFIWARISIRKINKISWIGITWYPSRYPSHQGGWSPIDRLSFLELRDPISTQKHWYVRKKSYCEIRLKRKLRVTRPGTHVSRFSSLVCKKAKICDMLLSVYCVSDASLKFPLTPNTHACSDLKFFPTWLSNI